MIDYPQKIDPSNDHADESTKGTHKQSRDTFQGFTNSFQSSGAVYMMHKGRWGALLKWLMVSYPSSWIRRAIPPLFYGWLVSLGFQPKNHTMVALIGLILFYRHFERKLFHRLSSLGSLPVQPFMTGYLFGFGYFLGGLYWIVYALHIDWLQYAALVPLALFGIPAVLALGFGVVTKGTQMISMLVPSSRLIVLVAFVVLWSCFDYTRGHILTGFPWLILSELWLAGDLVIQSLSLFGSYGLGLMTLILCALLYGIIFFGPGYRKANLIAFLTLGAALVFYGQWSLTQYKKDFHTEFDVVIVQPNIHQVHKWDPEKLTDNVDRLIGLSTQSQLTPFSGQSLKPKVYIWPEAAVPYNLESGTAISRYITQFLGKNDILITGYNRFVPSDTHGKSLFFNSLIALDQQGTMIDLYDKSHLVPFGEYIPFRTLMPQFIDALAAGGGDFSKGRGRKTMTLKGVPAFSPLICYEAIFANEVIDHEKRPQWLLNITNDGWYLGSAGIYQHLHLTRMRAIEEGLPLVRVNYRGVSAVFDPIGRIIEDISFDRAEGKQVQLPKASQQRPLYSVYGDRIYFALLVGLMALMVYLAVRTRRVKRGD